MTEVFALPLGSPFVPAVQRSISVRCGARVLAGFTLCIVLSGREHELARAARLGRARARGRIQAQPLGRGTMSFAGTLSELRCATVEITTLGAKTGVLDVTHPGRLARRAPASRRRAHERGVRRSPGERAFYALVSLKEGSLPRSRLSTWRSWPTRRDRIAARRVLMRRVDEIVAGSRDALPSFARATFLRGGPQDLGRGYGPGSPDRGSARSATSSTGRWSTALKPTSTTCCRRFSPACAIAARCAYSMTSVAECWRALERQTSQRES